MTQLEQIKAEIERRMEIFRNDNIVAMRLAINEDLELLNFIESLEE